MEFESHSLSLVGLQESKAAPAVALHDGEAAKTLQEQWYLLISSKIIF